MIDNSSINPFDMGGADPHVFQRTTHNKRDIPTHTKKAVPNPHSLSQTHSSPHTDRNRDHTIDITTDRSTVTEKKRKLEHLEAVIDPSIEQLEGETTKLRNAGIITNMKKHVYGQADLGKDIIKSSLSTLEKVFPKQVVDQIGSATNVGGVLLHVADFGYTGTNLIYTYRRLNEAKEVLKNAYKVLNKEENQVEDNKNASPLIKKAFKNWNAFIQKLEKGEHLSPEDIKKFPALNELATRTTDIHKQKANIEKLKADPNISKEQVVKAEHALKIDDMNFKSFKELKAWDFVEQLISTELAKRRNPTDPDPSDIKQEFEALKESALILNGHRLDLKKWTLFVETEEQDLLESSLKFGIKSTKRFFSDMKVTLGFLKHIEGVAPIAQSLGWSSAVLCIVLSSLIVMDTLKGAATHKKWAKDFRLDNQNPTINFAFDKSNSTFSKTKNIINDEATSTDDDLSTTSSVNREVTDDEQTETDQITELSGRASKELQTLLDKRLNYADEKTYIKQSVQLTQNQKEKLKILLPNIASLRSELVHFRKPVFDRFESLIREASVDDEEKIMREYGVSAEFFVDEDNQPFNISQPGGKEKLAAFLEDYMNKKLSQFNKKIDSTAPSKYPSILKSYKIDPKKLRDEKGERFTLEHPEAKEKLKKLVESQAHETLNKIMKEVYKADPSDYSTILNKYKLNPKFDVAEKSGVEKFASHRAAIFTKWVNSKESHIPLLKAYIDHQETLSITSKGAIKQMVDTKHKLEGEFFRFKVLESKALFTSLVVSIALSAVFTILAATAVFTAPAALLLAISLSGTGLGFGLMIAGYVLLQKRKPSLFKASFAGTFTKLKVAKLMHYVRDYQQNARLIKRDKQMEIIDTFIKARSIENNSDPLENVPSEEEYEKALQLYAESKREFEQYEQKAKYWNKKINKFQERLTAGSWDDFSTYAKLSGPGYAKAKRLEHAEKLEKQIEKKESQKMLLIHQGIKEENLTQLTKQIKRLKHKYSKYAGEHAEVKRDEKLSNTLLQQIENNRQNQKSGTGQNIPIYVTDEHNKLQRRKALEKWDTLDALSEALEKCDPLLLDSEKGEQSLTHLMNKHLGIDLKQIRKEKEKNAAAFTKALQKFFTLDDSGIVEFIKQQQTYIEEGIIIKPS